MSEPAAHPVPDHRAAHGAAHHEPDPGRLAGRVPDQQVHGQQAPSRPAAAPHRQGELRAAPHACLRGKHQRRQPRGLRPRPVRRSAARAPCACAQRAPPARRGCACAGGIRASSRGGDCSAEMYACSLRAPDAVLGSRPTAQAAASALRRPGGQLTRVGAVIRTVKPGCPRAARQARENSGSRTPAPARHRPRVRAPARLQGPSGTGFRAPGPGSVQRKPVLNQPVTGTLPFTERAEGGTLRLWRTGSGPGRGHEITTGLMKLVSTVLRARRRGRRSQPVDRSMDGHGARGEIYE